MRWSESRRRGIAHLVLVRSMNSFPKTLIAAMSLALGAQFVGAQEAPKDFWAFRDQKFPYDQEARAKRMSGTGVFRLRIDQKTGKVTEIGVIQSTGWRHLDQAAAATLIRWRARIPASRSTVTVPVTFLSSPR